MRHFIQRSKHEGVMNDEEKEAALKEAETLALKTLKAVMEEKINVKNVDMASVAPTYAKYQDAAIQEIIDRL
mgnify:CR=1 FL=1